MEADDPKMSSRKEKKNTLCDDRLEMINPSLKYEIHLKYASVWHLLDVLCNRQKSRLLKDQTELYSGV